jgi:hypothetical protein
VLATIPRLSPEKTILAQVAQPNSRAPVPASISHAFTGSAPVGKPAPGAAKADHKSAPPDLLQAKADETAKDEAETNAASEEFKKEDVLTLLKLFDPVVYDWWTAKRGVIVANHSEHWFSFQGWIPFGNRWGSLDENGVPHMDVDKTLSAFDVVEAIVESARWGNLNQSGANFAHGFAYYHARLDGPTQDYDTKAFAQWQQTAFGRGRAFAATLADMYVQGIISVVPGGDALMVAGDLMQGKFDTGTLINALPFVTNATVGAVAVVTVKYGDQLVKVPAAAFQRFKGLAKNVQETILTAIQRSPNVAKAIERFQRLVEGGKIAYGNLDHLGRPTGVKATITPAMIKTGSDANERIRPPGFGGKDAGHARAHLLGAQLGGSGDDARNLVTFRHIPSNTPVMRRFERQVREAVEKGEIVEYSATPLYVGAERLPKGITIVAKGDLGFSLEVTIKNAL